ncbi:unnamed protein product [Prunus armeniaca]|uniref:Uncharacterized protein n=1 Tax=Prunus armeniaca TaxID=36596 RepID=A0A6J5WU59_PRUAR|nr:unnamed protein product [Prunus armeniaca]
MSPSHYSEEKGDSTFWKHRAAKQASEKPNGTWLEATNDFITTRASSPKRSNCGGRSRRDGDEGNGTRDHNIQRIVCTNDMHGSKENGGPKVNGERNDEEGNRVKGKNVEEGGKKEKSKGERVAVGLMH